MRELKTTTYTFFQKHYMSMVIFALLLFTQIYFTLNNNVTLSGKTKIFITNAALLVYALYFVFYKLILRKQYKVLDKKSKFLFWFLILFVAYVFLSYGYRFYVLDNRSISLAMTQTILLAAVTFLIVDKKKISFDEIILGISYFLFIINAIVIFIIMFLKINLRSIPVLGNVNVYIGFILLITPLLIYVYEKKSHLIFYRVLFYFTVISTLTGFIFTGSRFSFVFYVVELSLVYIIIHGVKVSQSAVKSFIGIIGTVILITLVFSYSNSYRKADVKRTFSLPISIVTRILNIETSYDMLDNINRDIIPDRTVPDENEDVSRVSMTRSRLFGQSLHEIEDNLLLGKGTHAVRLKGWGYQSPHNFILEILLCYGIIGGMIYSLVAFYPIYLMIRRRKTKEALLFLTGYGSIFLFSMVEPLLADKLVILLPLWLLSSSIALQDSPTEKVEIKAKKA